MKIAYGWRLYTADFSLQAGGKDVTGTATLIRDPDGRAAWLRVPPEMREDPDGPKLYVYGSGATIEEAIGNANRAAVKEPMLAGDDRRHVICVCPDCLGKNR